MSAIVTPRPGKAMCKDAAFQIFTKRLEYIGLGVVVVALAIELSCTGQLKPGLVVLGDGLVQKSPLGMARVVELGLRTSWPARV